VTRPTDRFGPSAATSDEAASGSADPAASSQPEE
jgi:hypothetical protein